MSPRDPGEILLSHGAGGRRTHELVREIFLPRFNNDALAALEDSARVHVGTSQIAFTTDSFVVSPIEFPGGDLGKLSICGTVNDLAALGARPIAISAGFLLEEGFEIDRLTRLVDSMRAVCDEVGVPIVTGDTKVVERGGLDRIFINTAGIGVLEAPLPQGAATISEGDRILVTGPIGDHGMAVMSARNDLRIESTIESDCAPLSGMVRSLLRGCPQVRWMRDPTRGGLATTLNELVAGTAFGVLLAEESIPVKPSVLALSEILGLDPLYVACEGRMVVVVEESGAAAALAHLRADRYGTGAAMIGRVVADSPGRVVLQTRIGGRRVLDMLSGDQLPRIC